MHPILFQTQNFIINTLWIFIAFSIVTGMYILIRMSVKYGLKIQFLSDNSWKLILVSLVGARILAIIINYQTYFYEFSPNAILKIFYFWDKGLSLLGAIIFFLPYFYRICKKNEQDFFKWLDIIVPSFIIALSITHLGYFFEGANYGRETSLPWGVNFESPAIKYTVPIHPTQIYAFIYSLGIGIVLMLLPRNKKISAFGKKGFIGLAGIGIYSLFRFLEGFVRGDEALSVFGVRGPQIVSFIILIITGILLYLRYNKPAKNPKKD